ncbi:hypothetical protein HAP90_00240 [Klebsiella quasipneumoniae subsp. similipneumoniae]|uniref:hypothetical protein n=1 Tax=Klebsiella quasipneumoniae TaxID=1463165 RepID=UPI0013FDECAB|nr:hypothetical protein [Klebsiella quasipneumoniae]NHJ27363.1 hypothetical protein [Klebsiella quasipneumoniae subsp. similipneumoniae]NHJ50065.1 hypothetical protein [Klebsiella quasipneumoniae subsp. similipneumoniae]NHJ64853.1 hypothetical protein [Klebsiella quasipneumoniae subsp. similipneumoniae]NHJ73363.1 hypothetical protein [Klebsiella quasipneumoniae subsp. similipneumoniae]NHJ80049.1 hypothetical protein [Klebsiella quasipneumoniae subsp. similipneumoniae]
MITAMDVWNWISSNFDIKIITILGAAFTVYFGWQKVTNKVSVSYSITMDRLYDSYINHLVITNERDKVFTVKNVMLEIGDLGYFTLVKFEDPLVIKGYETHKVSIPKYSELNNRGERIKLTPHDTLSFYMITYSGKKIKCSIENYSGSISGDKQINVIVNRFNDIVLTDNMKFIFLYRINDGEKTCIIDSGYFINKDNPFQFNMFHDFSVDGFKNILIRDGYHQWFESYMLFQVNEGVGCSFVFSKASVETEIAKSGRGVQE